MSPRRTRRTDATAPASDSTSAPASDSASEPAQAGHAPASPRRRVGRPREAVLSRELIMETAAHLVATDGVEKFTLASLANRLGCTPAAIYNHTASKLDILRGVEDIVMERVDSDGFTEDIPWQDAVRRWARSYRDVMSEHSGLISVIAQLPIEGAPATVAMYERVTVGLLAAGIPEDHVVPTIVAIESFIFGSALDVSAPADIFDVHDASTAPTFSRAVRYHRDAANVPGAVPSADVAFALGLEALIDGMARRIA